MFFDDGKDEQKRSSIGLVRYLGDNITILVCHHQHIIHADHPTTLTTLILFPPYHLDHLDHQDQLEHSIHPDPEQEIEKFAKPFFWNKSYLQPKIAKKNLERNICEKVATVSKKIVCKVIFQALQKGCLERDFVKT